MAPSHPLLRPYYACKSRFRYVVLARGGHSKKFVWAMLTIPASRARPTPTLSCSLPPHTVLPRSRYPTTAPVSFMSQFWSDAKSGKAYPPVQPRKEHAERARAMKTKVTEILGIECVLAGFATLFVYTASVRAEQCGSSR